MSPKFSKVKKIGKRKSKKHTAFKSAKLTKPTVNTHLKKAGRPQRSAAEQTARNTAAETYRKMRAERKAGHSANEGGALTSDRVAHMKRKLSIRHDGEHKGRRGGFKFTKEHRDNISEGLKAFHKAKGTHKKKSHERKGRTGTKRHNRKRTHSKRS